MTGEIQMNNKILPYLLPVRCIIFLVIFIVGALVTGRKVDEISNWWSITASIVIGMNLYVIIYEHLCTL